MKKDIIYSKSFKSWFGDWENDPENSSKVVDKDGKPLIVYHGSNNKFNTFDINMSREASDIQGIFLSSDIEESYGYGKNVRSFYVNIRNPANGDDAFKIWYKYYKQGDGKAGVKARKDLQSMGYDGVIRDDEDIYEYVVFSANQVKSINNNGNFSKESDNIYENESNKTMNNYKQFFDKYTERTININNVAYQANLVNAVRSYLENNGYQATDNAVASGCKSLMQIFKNENVANGYASNYGTNPTNKTRIDNALANVFPPRPPQEDPINDLAGITTLTKDELKAMANNGPISKVMANLMKGKISINFENKKTKNLISNASKFVNGIKKKVNNVNNFIDNSVSEGVHPGIKISNIQIISTDNVYIDDTNTDTNTRSRKSNNKKSNTSNNVRK